MAAKKKARYPRSTSAGLQKVRDLWYYIQARQEAGQTPSVREYDKFGIKSSSVALYYLRKMETLNMIQKRARYQARTILLIAPEFWDAEILDWMKKEDA